MWDLQNLGNQQLIILHINIIWKYYLEHGSSKEYKKYKRCRFVYGIINQTKVHLKSGYNRIFKK